MPEDLNPKTDMVSQVSSAIKEMYTTFLNADLTKEFETLRYEVFPQIQSEIKKLPIKSFLLLPISSLLDDLTIITAHDTPGGVSRGRLFLSYARMILDNLTSYKDKKRG